MSFKRYIEKIAFLESVIFPICNCAHDNANLFFRLLRMYVLHMKPYIRVLNTYEAVPIKFS